MVYIIQFVANLSEFSGKKNFICRKAFSTREKAEEYLPIFLDSCKPTKKDLAGWDMATGRTYITELEYAV